MNQVRPCKRPPKKAAVLSSHLASDSAVTFDSYLVLSSADQQKKPHMLARKDTPSSCPANLICIQATANLNDSLNILQQKTGRIAQQHHAEANKRLSQPTFFLNGSTTDSGCCTSTSAIAMLAPCRTKSVLSLSMASSSCTASRRPEPTRCGRYQHMHLYMSSENHMLSSLGRAVTWPRLSQQCNSRQEYLMQSSTDSRVFAIRLLVLAASQNTSWKTHYSCHYGTTALGSAESTTKNKQLEVQQPKPTCTCDTDGHCSTIPHMRIEALRQQRNNLWALLRSPQQYKAQAEHCSTPDVVTHVRHSKVKQTLYCCIVACSPAGRQSKQQVFLQNWPSRRVVYTGGFSGVKILHHSSMQSFWHKAPEVHALLPALHPKITLQSAHPCYTSVAHIFPNNLHTSWHFYIINNLVSSSKSTSQERPLTTMPPSQS